MKPLQEKLAKYDAPQKAKALGVYPYFRKIESEQDTEVIINGKKVLMFGSNSYLGPPEDKRGCNLRYQKVWYGLCWFPFPEWNS